mgnify:CR=1 FL=1
MRGWWMPAVRPASTNKKGRLTSSCIMSTETVSNSVKQCQTVSMHQRNPNAVHIAAARMTHRNQESNIAALTSNGLMATIPTVTSNGPKPKALFLKSSLYSSITLCFLVCKVSPCCKTKLDTQKKYLSVILCRIL